MIRLREMRPRQTVGESANARRADSKSHCDFGKLTNDQVREICLRRSEGATLGVVMMLPKAPTFGPRSEPLTVAPCLPALPIPVANVVGIRSKPQVRGIAARRVVAMVEHTQTVGDGAVRDDPRQSVGPNLTILESDAAISVLVTAGSPKPARFRSANLGPKIVSGILPCSHRRASVSVRGSAGQRPSRCSNSGRPRLPILPSCSRLYWGFSS